MEESRVLDPPCDPTHQDVVVDSIEKSLEVEIHYESIPDSAPSAYRSG